MFGYELAFDMLDVATCIGYFFLFGIACVLIAYAHNLIQERREGYRERQFYKAIAEAKIQIGRTMIQESYWLTPEHMKVMHLLGKKFLENGGYNISEFRKELETYDPNRTGSDNNEGEQG
jgi:hypothetical protein